MSIDQFRNLAAKESPSGSSRSRACKHGPSARPAASSRDSLLSMTAQNKHDADQVSIGWPPAWLPGSTGLSDHAKDHGRVEHQLRPGTRTVPCSESM
jgi:hypothetical protein